MKYINLFLLLTMALLTLNCDNEDNQNPPASDDAASIQKGRGLSADVLDNLQYHEITFKGSHNSYERDETIAEQLDWIVDDGKTSEDGNCMGIEFDIWRHTSDFDVNGWIDEGFWTVDHISGSGGRNLSEWLEEVKQWHDSHSNDFPIMLKLDVKSTQNGYQNFHEQIDTYLKRYLGESLIFKPQNLFMEPGLDLAQNVMKYGWPTINQMRGKIIVVLTGNSDWGGQYADTDLETDRLCFTMQELPADSYDVYPPSSGKYIFFNFHIYHKNRDKWMTSIPRFLDNHFITRVYIANSEDNFNDSITAMVSCISTDKVNNHSWAVVTDNYKFDRKY